MHSRLTFATTLVALAAAVPTSPLPPTPVCKETYKTKEGETCFSLDAQFDLVSGSILAANLFLNCWDIWADSEICIPDGPYRVEHCLATYSSVDGDTCEKIEAAYNLVDGSILLKNQYLDCDSIWANSPICVPDGPYKTVETCKETYISAVEDTCQSIDTKFELPEGTTQAHNSFLDCANIWEWTPICIPKLQSQPQPQPQPETQPQPQPETQPQPQPEPQPETQPGKGESSGDVQTGGFATFFYQNGNAGACGESHSDEEFIAAISEQAYGFDYSRKSSMCNRKVKITNSNNGASVDVVIVDSCPTCNNDKSLDLSKAAFLAIAPESDGMVPITWEFIN